MRPRATIDSRESIDDLYDFYEDHQQSQLFARLGHFALSKVYRPSITFAEGAEEAIGEAIANDTRLIISPNHLTGDDQYVIVSMAQKEPVLHPLRGHTFIPAEPSLFTAKWRRGGQLLRRAVDGLGAIPIYRKEDLKRMGLSDDEEAQKLYEYALLQADEIETTRLVRGDRRIMTGNRYPIAEPSDLPYDHMAVFWEGTRNRVNHTRVQPLKLGPAYTACRAAEDVNLAVLPVGFYYGGEPTSYKKLNVPAKRKPTVHIGMPIPVEAQDPRELVELVHPAIQACVDVAVAATNN